MARTKPAKANAKKTLPKSKPTAKPAPKTAKAAPSGDLAKALASGDGRRALDAALVAWRAARAPALADLVDAISARISGPSVTDEVEWTKLAAAKDPVVFGRLLGGIRELPVSFLPTVSQRLAAFDDPRLANAAAEWVLDPPCTSTSAYPFWTKLYEVLVKLGDTRAIEPLQKRVTMPPKETQQWAGAKPKPSQFWAKFYAALDKTRAQLEQITVPTVDKDAIAKLAKQVGSLAVIEGAAPAAKPAKAKAVGPPLVQALAHANAGRVDAAIEAMLDAWREKRAPEIADLIDRASRLLPSWDLPLPVDNKAAHAAWQAAFAADPMRNLPQLLRHVNVGGSSAAVEHVASLATLPEDPRIAIRLAELAATHTISAQKSQYWTRCWETIARLRDVRVIAPLRQHFTDFTGTYWDHHRSGRRLLGDFVLGELPPSPLDASDHKSINQLAAALGTLEAAADHRERELIADIVKNWSDEGPRLVYADWLTERGHLRGELIVLDCKLAREGKLSAAETKQHAAMRTSFRAVTYLYGPISDLRHTLDRGIPNALDVEYLSSTITWRHLLDYPLLAALESIAFEETIDARGRPQAADLARVMLDPTAIRLTKVTTVPNDENGLLASELEPLVKPQWRRENSNFVRG